MNDENGENNGTNGAIDLDDVRKLARGASTLGKGASTLKRLTSLFGGKSRRSVPRSAAKKTTSARRAKTTQTMDIPGLGKVPASTVKKWAPTIGGLILGRMLTRSSSGGSARKSAPSSHRRTGPDAPAQGDAETARYAPPQGNPYLKWIILFFVVALVVWWLADGGAQVCADAIRRLQAPAATTATAEKPAKGPAGTDPGTTAEKPAKAKRGKAKGSAAAAASAPTSPEVLADGLWWEGRGVVEKVLPDDTEPPRHQRFFLRDDRGRSLFFAHNIDEAPRVPDLKEGDEISFRGEWRDNEGGGAMHWTRRAGAGRRKGGWLERNGVRYE